MENLLNDNQKDAVNDLMNGKKLKKNKKAQIQMTNDERNKLLTQLLGTNLLGKNDNRNDKASSSNEVLTPEQQELRRKEELRAKLRNKVGSQQMMRGGKKALEQQLQHKMKDVLKDKDINSVASGSQLEEPVPELEEDLGEYMK